MSETTPEILGPDSGAEVPPPVSTPSAPLIQTPAGCPPPPLATVVFVGTLVAKDRNTARYQVDQIRAGSADAYIVTGLVDVSYVDETQYLSVDDRYLVGAVPSGVNLALSSKVRAANPLFGGNAVIGLTDSDTECAAVEDPIRTLHLDGSEVENSLFTGLKGSSRQIALAFLQPLAIAFGVILALVLVRWMFTAFFVSMRRAVDGEPITTLGGARRRRLPGS